MVFWGHKFHTWLEDSGFHVLSEIQHRGLVAMIPWSFFLGGGGRGGCCPWNNSIQYGSLHNLKKTTQNAAEKRDSISFFTSSFHSRSWNITATGLRALSCLAMFDKSCNVTIEFVLVFVLWWICSHCACCVCISVGLCVLLSWRFCWPMCCWFLFALVQIAGCTLYEDPEANSSHLNNWHLKMKPDRLPTISF